MNGVVLDPRTGRPEQPRAEILTDLDFALLRHEGELTWRDRVRRLRAEGVLTAMANEGQFYHETRTPFTDVADFPTITLLTTSLMLFPVAGGPTATSAGYWQIGKKMQIQCFGKFTTALTPGNLTIEVRYGTADNAGTILATSAAVALTASKTNISWFFEVQVEARSAIGTAAGLFAWGRFISNQSGLLIPAANNPWIIPESAAAAVNVDTTVASGINIQMKRSGSTVETVTVQDRQVNALT